MTTAIARWAEIPIERRRAIIEAIRLKADPSDSSARGRLIRPNNWGSWSVREREAYREAELDDLLADIRAERAAADLLEAFEPGASRHVHPLRCGVCQSVVVMIITFPRPHGLPCPVCGEPRDPLCCPVGCGADLVRDSLPDSP